MLLLFGATIFVSAALLFVVQPMFARMVLPLLGGAPAVWNTALVFYQAALLAGYGYAHATTAWLGRRRQALPHVLLLLLPLLVLPITVPRGLTPPGAGTPIPWLLAVLAAAVGLPFFVVSTTSPVLQAWFAGTLHRTARDPYFLYAASNLGSMLALLSYPLLVERWLRLGEQSRWWAVGYGVLACLIATCGLALRRSPTGAGRDAAPRAPDGPDPTSPAEQADTHLGASRRARWVLLALVPSSLMLSVTTYVSTDIAAIPLLWVVPLTLYLVTFIIAFARHRLLPHRLVVDAFPVVMLPLVIVLAARANEPLALVIPTHLAAFFAAALLCHGELAEDRPDPRHLTEFYLWMSTGGVLGGAFTALVAPLVFTSVVEYPLMLVLACALGSRSSSAGTRKRALDVFLPLTLGVLAVALVAALQAHALGLEPAAIGPVFGVLGLVCLTFARRPLRFALGVGVLLLAGTLYHGQEGRLQYAERSFFGISRVTLDPTGRYRLLMHGTTLHGMQALDPARRTAPLTYYYPTGPLGQLFAALGGTAATRSVAVVGLGAGSIACYGHVGEHWTFYEIDPTVLRIAADPRYFTFLRDCPPELHVRLGDARLSLAATDSRYGLIILDAYSSDAPPIHLLTLEAVRLYLARLAEGGLLIFNVSNRHLDLEPVLGSLARAAGLQSLTRDDARVDDAERYLGKTESHWVVMARAPTDFGPLRTDPRWRPARAPVGAAVWTDDFSDLLSAFRWR